MENHIRLSLNRTSHNSIPDTMVINGLECTDIFFLIEEFYYMEKIHKKEII